jgi:uncharacterized protein
MMGRVLRAVLDSSVLVSAFITPHGPSGQLLDAAEGGAFVLCLSREIIAETVATLTGKPKLQARYGYAPGAAEAYWDVLVALAQPVAELPDLAGTVPNDPKDDMVVATAVAAGADYLVAGDRRHLLRLGAYRGVRVVGVREFLDLL